MNSTNITCIYRIVIRDSKDTIKGVYIGQTRDFTRRVSEHYLAISTMNVASTTNRNIVSLLKMNVEYTFSFEVLKGFGKGCSKKVLDKSEKEFIKEIEKHLLLNIQHKKI